MNTENVASDLDWTPLVYAARQNDFAFVKEIGHLNALNVRNMHEANAAMLAIASDDFNTLKALIDALPSYSSIEDGAVNLMCIASQYGRVEIIKYLYERMPSLLNAPCRLTGMSPLMMAVMNDRINVTRLLLKLGARCDVENKWCQSIFDLLPLREGRNMEMELLLHSYCSPLMQTVADADRTTLKRVADSLNCTPAKKKACRARECFNSPVKAIFTTPVQNRKQGVGEYSSVPLAPKRSVTTRLRQVKSPCYYGGGNGNLSGPVTPVNCHAKSYSYETPYRRILPTSNKKCSKFRIALDRIKMRKLGKIERKKEKLLSNYDMKTLLKKLNLARYAHYFINEKIDVETLLSLNDSDLVEIGITNEADRMRILKRIYKYITQ